MAWGASTSSWSARARYSPVASVSAALVLAAMPLFSTFFVYDSLIFLLIFPYNTLHLGVGVVGSVHEAELTIGGGLVHKGAQKFPQVIFGRIIQRGQDGDGGQAAVLSGLADHFGGLSFQHLFAGQIARPLAEENGGGTKPAPRFTIVGSPSSFVSRTA